MNEHLLRLINKYNDFGLAIEGFEALKKYCLNGEEIDYSLIPKYKPGNPKPKGKIHPGAKLHRAIYDMWLHQLKSIAEITDILRKQRVLDGYTRIEDIQRVSKIVKRMNSKDPNRDKYHGPTPGRRLKKTK